MTWTSRVDDPDGRILPCYPLLQPSQIGVLVPHTMTERKGIAQSEDCALASEEGRPLVVVPAVQSAVRQPSEFWIRVEPVILDAVKNLIAVSLDDIKVATRIGVVHVLAVDGVIFRPQDPEANLKADQADQQRQQDRQDLESPALGGGQIVHENSPLAVR